MKLSQKELGQYLKKLRENVGLTTREVYNLSEVSNSYLSLVENGQRTASATVLKKLASVYNVNYLELYEKAGYIDLIKDDKNEFNQLNESVISIPMLKIIKNGYSYLNSENQAGTYMLQSDIAKNGEYFALQITGDNMYPLFIEGDTIIIRKQNDCESGEVAAILIGDDEAIINKVIKREDYIELESFNPYYPKRKFTKSEIKNLPVTIFGVVIKLDRNINK